MGKDFKNVQKNKAAALKRPTPITPRDREVSDNLVDLQGRREADRSRLRTREITRLPDSDGVFVLRHNWSVLRQRKDQDDLLVGNKDVDTLRTQLDIYIKHEAGRNLGTPFYIGSEKDPIYGISDKKINLLQDTNRAALTAIDGFKVELSQSSYLTPALIDDLRDIEVYGRREYSAKATVNDSNSSVYGVYRGSEVMPKGVRILSGSTKIPSSVSPFGSEISFEIHHERHSSDIASVGIKTLDSQVLADTADRKEPFSINVLVDAGTNIPTFYFNNPQIDSNNIATFSTTTDVPTNLIQKTERVYITELKSGFNWSGRSGEILGLGPNIHDIVTLAISGSASIAYSAEKEATALAEIFGDGPYDRAAIERVEDIDDDAFYRVTDQTVFRDRYDIEFEQASPNLNLNYKNLNIRRALQAAYSTPLANDNMSYRSIGLGSGYSIYSGISKPRLEIGAQYTQSYVVEYDNAYITRPSQNNYDQRWYRKSNLVRLGEANNAPYKNVNLSSLVANSIMDYPPLTSSYYNEDQIVTLPHSEETTSSAPFGDADVNIDFLGTNIVVNRSIDLDDYAIDGTTNGYINPQLGGSKGVIDVHKRLHYYLLNANGPYEAASWKLSQVSGPTHVYSIINGEKYKNTLSVQISENMVDNGVLRIKTNPFCCKGRKNTAIVAIGVGNLHAVNYEVMYPPPSEYFSSGSSGFDRLPKEYRKNPLEMKSNRQYLCLFDEQRQQLNNSQLKYFDYSEQIFPRKQLTIDNLINYDIAVKYPQVLDRRKVHLEKNSLDREFPDHSSFVNCNFSSWSVEAPILETNYGSSVTVHDGELMQLNYDAAYVLYSDIVIGPYRQGSIDQYYNLTLGYKISHQNRPDSVSPLKNARKPYKMFREHMGPDVSDHPCMGAMAEYRLEDHIDNYLDGVSDMESSLTLFGHDSSIAGKNLLGEASYTDEIFELKDIHRQIDKF